MAGNLWCDGCSNYISVNKGYIQFCCHNTECDLCLYGNMYCDEHCLDRLYMKLNKVYDKKDKLKCYECGHPYRIEKKDAKF